MYYQLYKGFKGQLFVSYYDENGNQVGSSVPGLFGGDALWFAMPAATLATSAVCVVMLIKQYYRKKNLW